MGDITLAKDIMVRRLQVLKPDMEVSDAVKALLRKGHSGAPVVDEEGKLLGVLSEYDCIRSLTSAVFDEWPVGPVRGFMTTPVECVAPDTDLATLASRFIESKLRRLLVVDDGKLVGLVSRGELLDALQDKLQPAHKLTTYELIEREDDEL